MNICTLGSASKSGRLSSTWRTDATRKRERVSHLRVTKFDAVVVQILSLHLTDHTECNMEGRRPLQYIDERPFPELNLTIDRQPVRIAHTESFNEDVDRETVNLATAIATTLWRWHPNALRAFLDFEKFPQVEWTRRNVGESCYNTCVITRIDQQVVVSYILGAGSP